MSSVAMTVRAALGANEEREWLFGRRTDLLAFGGSTLLAFALLALGYALGLLSRDTPLWVWLLCVVGVDVAHVWSTLFRVYLDPAEVRRRLVLYVGAPLLAYLIGLLAFGMSPVIFWSVVAYTAVFHFVRQQAGWMRLYHRRDSRVSRYERILDLSATYLAMLYPLVFWHTHLPRRFAWMIEGDFIAGASESAAMVLRPVYFAVLLAWSVQFVLHARNTRRPAWGRLLLLSSTALTWYVGIVVFDSDFAFTVMNVLVHGIPYFVLTFRYGRARAQVLERGMLWRLARIGWPAFLAIVLALAFTEEVLWDRWVWHDHSALFGVSPQLDETLLAFLVPLLAMPQLTHYLLDGFIWRARGND